MRHGQSHETDRKMIGLSLLAVLRRTKRSMNISSLAVIATGLCLGLVAIGFTPHQVAAADKAAQVPSLSHSSPVREVAEALSAIETQPVAAPHPKRANFEREHKSPDVQHVADWVVDSGDNLGMSFAIVDKTDAKVYVFDAEGRLRGAAPVLVGLAKGDDSVPGIGDRKLSDVRPEERTTPAGRFVAVMGDNFNGKDVLWVDYAGAVSMHRVITSNPKEHRLERLASPKPLEHRISYGCINVPAKFFDDFVSPAFTGTNGIVYVLPEIRSNKEFFASYYDVR